MSEGEKCPHCGNDHAELITPKMRHEYDQMQAQNAEEMGSLLGGWRSNRRAGDPEEMDVSVLLDVIIRRYTFSGAVRLLAWSVKRIAELEDRIDRLQGKDPRT
jgi:hypothetical protein